jgi:hypothetical protein
MELLDRLLDVAFGHFDVNVVFEVGRRGVRCMLCRWSEVMEMGANEGVDVSW